MKKITSIIIIALTSINLYGQNSQTDISVVGNEAKNAAYFGGIRQGALYAKYERRILLTSWTNTIFNIGLGSLPGEYESGIPRTLKIMPEIAQTIGYKNFFLEIGIEPSFNFYGKLAYVDLNGIIGLRYQSLKKESIFFQLGYNPRLYSTYDSQIDLPFYAALGLSF